MKLFGVVLAALLVAVASGCGDGDGGQQSGAAAPTGTSASGPTPSGTSAPTGTTNTPPPIPDIDGGKDRSERTSTQTVPRKGGNPSDRTGSTPDSRRVERYIRDNFGGAGARVKSSWYDHVVEITVSGTTTTIKTDLTDGRLGKRLAQQMCLDVRGSIPGVTDTVRVVTLAGNALAKCVP